MLPKGKAISALGRPVHTSLPTLHALCYHNGRMAVEFNEQEFTRPGQMQGTGGQGGVTGLIMKLGLAKTVAQANIVMLVIAIIAGGLAVYFALPSRATAPSGVIPAGVPMGIPLSEGGP